MPSLVESLLAKLQKENLTQNDWLELIQRLLDYGVLCRDESQVEAELYDKFVRIEGLVDEYVSLMGLRIFHDLGFQYVRVIPPGARVPGVEDETDAPFNGGLRAKLTQVEVTLVLTLRAEYDKALREGNVDEQGCVSMSMEMLILALKNLLNRSLPENITERRSLFKRLRQLRVIRTSPDRDVLDSECWIKIRPTIVHLVNNELIADLSTFISEADKTAVEHIDGDSNTDAESNAFDNKNTVDKTAINDENSTSKGNNIGLEANKAASGQSSSEKVGKTKPAVEDSLFAE